MVPGKSWGDLWSIYPAVARFAQSRVCIVPLHWITSPCPTPVGQFSGLASVQGWDNSKQSLAPSQICKACGCFMTAFMSIYAGTRVWGCSVRVASGKQGQAWTKITASLSPFVRGPLMIISMITIIMVDHRHPSSIFIITIYSMCPSKVCVRETVKHRYHSCIKYKLNKYQS